MIPVTMLSFLTQKLKSQTINECQPYLTNNISQLKDNGTESGTETEERKATQLECRTLSAGNPETIDGEREEKVLGARNYDGRFNPQLHNTQQQPTTTTTTTTQSLPPCNNSYFQHQQQNLPEQQLLQQQQQQQAQLQQQQQQHQLQQQEQQSDYTATMERPLSTEEDVKMEELQLSEDECQKDYQQEQQQQEVEEQAKLQLHSHHHNHHHSQQQQQQYECEQKHTDVLSENKIVIPTAVSSSTSSSSSVEVVAVVPLPPLVPAASAVSPQPTSNQQAVLPPSITHPISLHKDTQLSISPSSLFNSEEQQHILSRPASQQQQEQNKEGPRPEAAQQLDQEYHVSPDNASEAIDSPLNQEVIMSSCLNNSVNCEETAMNLSNMVSIPTVVPDSNINIATVTNGDIISPEPIGIDKPNELITSLREEQGNVDTVLTTRPPEEVDQSLAVSLQSPSPVLMATATTTATTTTPLSVVDQHSSEEELECINQENSHPEKRTWSQMNSDNSSNSVENNHPKCNIYHSFHPPHQQQQQHQQHHSPLHHNHHQQNHHNILQHHQQQSNINHNQQHRSSSSGTNGSNDSSSSNSSSSSSSNNNNSSNIINSQQHCHNHNNNLHNSNNNNSILINNSNICNNNNTTTSNNNNNNNINSNNNLNNNNNGSNNNSCCFTDSAGSSDEEVKEFMLDPKPILFSSTPPSGIQKVMRSSSANFLVPNGPPLSICAISPRKRHRLNSSSDSLDLENISVIQRPCLDFEKMQKTLMRKHTSHSVSRAKIVKIKTISGNGTSSKCWFDPAVCSFRSISTAYSPLPPVEEPSCAY